MASTTPTSVFGSRIDLISHRRVRYEGILSAIDAEKQTVTLHNVRLHGTEGRAALSNLPEIDGSDDIYEYIIFNRHDIYSLDVVEQPEPPRFPPMGFGYGYPYAYPPYGGYYPPPPSSYTPYAYPPSSGNLYPPPSGIPATSITSTFESGSIPAPTQIPSPIFAPPPAMAPIKFTSVSERVPHPSNAIPSTSRETQISEYHTLASKPEAKRDIVIGGPSQLHHRQARKEASTPTTTTTATTTRPGAQPARPTDKPDIKYPRGQRQIATSRAPLSNEAGPTNRTAQLGFYPGTKSDQYDFEAANKQFLKEVGNLTDRMKSLETSKTKDFFDHFSAEGSDVWYNNAATFGVSRGRGRGGRRGRRGGFRGRSSAWTESQHPPREVTTESTPRKQIE